MKKTLFAAFTLSFCLLVYAGGNPDRVDYPASYKTDFTVYDTRNRSNGNQVAVMYANNIALSTPASPAEADGSIVVMEVYKTIIGEDGKPVVGNNGVFEKGPLAAVAVMQKSSDWPSDYAATDRTNDWGYAIYQPDGMPKENDLECASCHRPLSGSNYMFSYSSLKKFLM